MLRFSGNELATALGYERAGNAIREHVHSDHRSKLLNIEFPRGPESGPLLKNEQEATWVSEPGLHELVFGSKKEVAQQFKLWLVREVMPQLVRTGSYGSQPQLPATPNDELQALQMEVLAAQAYKDRELAEQANCLLYTSDAADE